MSGGDAETALLRKFQTGSRQAQWSASSVTPLAPLTQSVTMVQTQPSLGNGLSSTQAGDFTSVDSSLVQPRISEQSLTAEKLEEIEQRIKENKELFSEMTGINQVKISTAVLKKRINRRVTYFKDITLQKYFTQEISRLRERGYLPYYATNFATNDIYFEFYERISALKTSFSAHYPAKFPVSSFQTYTDYEQGDLNIKKSPTLRGDTTNTYVVELNLVDVRNTFPVDIAVVVGFYDKNGLFNWLDGDTVDVPHYAIENLKDPAKKVSGVSRSRVHAIIPRETEKYDCNLYKNGPEINEDYGAMYPDVTDDYQTITRNCKVDGDDVDIHKESIVTRWLFEYGPYYGLETPGPATNMNRQQTHLSCKKKAFHTAVSNIKNIISASVPVRDLSKLELRFFPLCSANSIGKEIMDDINKQLRDMEKMLNINSKIDENMKDRLPAKLYTFSAKLRPIIVFRAMAAQSTSLTKYNDGDDDPDPIDE
jgi:hypothetical protein